MTTIRKRCKVVNTTTQSDICPYKGDNGVENHGWQQVESEAWSMNGLTNGNWIGLSLSNPSMCCYGRRLLGSSHDTLSSSLPVSLLWIHVKFSDLSSDSGPTWNGQVPKRADGTTLSNSDLKFIFSLIALSGWLCLLCKKCKQMFIFTSTIHLPIKCKNLNRASDASWNLERWVDDGGPKSGFVSCALSPFHSARAAAARSAFLYETQKTPIAFLWNKNGAEHDHTSLFIHRSPKSYFLLDCCSSYQTPPETSTFSLCRPGSEGRGFWDGQVAVETCSYPTIELMGRKQTVNPALWKNFSQQSIWQPLNVSGGSVYIFVVLELNHWDVCDQTT